MPSSGRGTTSPPPSSGSLWPGRVEAQKALKPIRREASSFVERIVVGENLRHAADALEALERPKSLKGALIHHDDLGIFLSDDQERRDVYAFQAADGVVGPAVDGYDRLGHLGLVRRGDERCGRTHPRADERSRKAVELRLHGYPFHRRHQPLAEDADVVAGATADRMQGHL